MDTTTTTIWRSIRDRRMRKKRQAINDTTLGKPINNLWRACATAEESRLYISIALRDEVYMRPDHYDRAWILAMLDQVVRNFPDHAPQILHEAFERVVENSSMDTGTWVIEQFLEHGASVHSAGIFLKAVQSLEINQAARPQVDIVLRRLLQAGANADAIWPEFGSKSDLQVLAENGRHIWGLEALIEALLEFDTHLTNAPASLPTFPAHAQVLAPILAKIRAGLDHMLTRDLEANTAPAPAPSRPAGRL
ncbi:MAG: hypothetical protein ACRER5_09070 [Pseudomonas sp.]